ncbi:hypodermin-A-like [Drosophila sulfurigaster albostrigata]|uniref:hypodermin-A-like n=1 Tax=Drosophila sulfurigaster albostrigata TaxID=89887 RepID=UPI002D21CFC5|nr:hypodermin-A-like [Drosophila sulfurigaster albostrigata]
MFPTLLVLISMATLGCALHFPIGPEFLLKKGPINNRIVGGEDTPIETIPWQVSLQSQGWHYCGGVIYSKNIIITAAHCVHNNDSKILDSEIVDVRVGSSTSDNGGSVIKVAKITVHDHYIHYVYKNDTPKSQYDIALILLSSPLEMGPTVKAIPLAESVPNDGAVVRVSGWGYTETGEAPLHLKSVYVNIVNLEKCARVNKIESTKAKICAASPRKDSCNGDSGGPLTYRSKLVGIVSFGPEICGDPSQPGVYTDVVELRQWIDVEATKLSSN